MEGGSECRPDAVQPVVRRKVVLRNSEINWIGFIPLLLNKCLEPYDRRGPHTKLTHRASGADGVHLGLGAMALEKSRPRSANASICGVGTRSKPRQPTQFFMSSTDMKRT